MNTRPKSKLEFIIITLLFSLLVYLIFTNASYERRNKINELNKIIEEQNEIIENYEQFHTLDELSIELRQLNEKAQLYHKNK